MVHRDEILRLLEQAAVDQNLIYELMHGGSDALEDYELTNPEKLAVLTADIDWIEKHVGQLNAAQRKWLESRRNANLVDRPDGARPAAAPKFESSWFLVYNGDRSNLGLIAPEGEP